MRAIWHFDISYNTPIFNISLLVLLLDDTNINILLILLICLILLI